MIKLRGQRVELGEVEHHVRFNLGDLSRCEGIAAEIIVPRNSHNPILAIFINLSREEINEPNQDTQSKLMRAVEGLEERLSERLPQYMVPGAYIHVERIPMTATK